GAFVLQNNMIKPLTRISSWEGRSETIKRAKLASAFPAGIIRGVLSRMGLPRTVTPEVTAPPHWYALSVRYPQTPIV
ncbi:hypothetical protein BKA82DRAFT_3970855, partial [Pisolithus tinctorius]